MSRLPTVCLGDADVSGKGRMGDNVMPEAIDCFLDAPEGQGGFATMMKGVSNQGLKTRSFVQV